ncbi:MAG: hypothetical protein R3F21_24465 [Myxococcota bacterium]
MTRNGIGARTRRMQRVIASGLLAVGFLLGAAIVVGPRVAAADQASDEAELRSYWQGRFRKLRMEEARLAQTAQLATKEYADSNRRTYRRSGVRHFHRTNAENAKAELELVRAQIASIYDEAREAGVPVFWLDEVAEEKIDMDRVEGLGVYADDGPFGGKGAYGPDEDDDADAAPDDPDAGRNPRFTRDDEAERDRPASLDETGQKRFDYDAWRKDRDQYERDRDPKRVPAADDSESGEEG